ncbi:MAG: GTP-binding protein [Myxococcales bacterium]|nr:GTP-binding protein [Myxococcales bacterium]
MLGRYGVGKTSLVARYVHSIFSPRYHTTVGVKINKKQLELDGRAVTLMLWDIHGEDDQQTIRPAYLRGAAGYALVADGTRRSTLAGIDSIHQRAQAQLGPVPFVVAFNKLDLQADWELTQEDAHSWRARPGCAGLFMTSAKTGARVEDMLRALARAAVEGR